MTVILEPAFVGMDQFLDNPRIGWRSIDGDAISSGDAAGFLADNAKDARTALGWKPDDDTGWIGIDAGEGVPVNYVGIAGHDLGTQNATIAVEYWDGAAWVAIVSGQPVENDEAIMVLFLAQVADQWRVRIESADAAPRIGHIRFGVVTEVPRKSNYAGTKPISESRRYEYDILRANNGAFLGRSVVSTSLQFTVSVQFVSEDWRRSEWAAFRDHANKGDATFFYADRPLSYPEDVAYAWSAGAVTADRGVNNRRVAVDFELQCEAL